MVEQKAGENLPRQSITLTILNGLMSVMIVGA
jgi:hypothetical protein